METLPPLCYTTVTTVTACKLIKNLSRSRTNKEKKPRSRNRLNSFLIVPFCARVWKLPIDTKTNFFNSTAKALKPLQIVLPKTPVVH